MDDTAVIFSDGLACPASPVPTPAAVLVRPEQGGLEILDAGPAARVRAHSAASGAREIDLTGHILLPGLVNAHTHLDLTAVGPHPRVSGLSFPDWLSDVLRARRGPGASVAESVDLGIAASLRGGVVAVGDIAGVGRTEPAEVLRRSPVIGNSYLELFGLGVRQQVALDRISADAPDIERWSNSPVRAGISPHAPYTAGPVVYESACASLAPLSTHLAESIEERQLICEGTGPMRDFLESLGSWNDSAGAHFGRFASPIAMAMPWLTRAPWLLAHVNDCSDDDLRALASTNCSVAYCPRGSSYFEHHVAFGPHRYRDMLAAGINVALGTDSVLNLPPGPESDRLSTIDEIRFLFRRDGTDPQVLVRMATTNGARALGLDPALFTLAPGRTAGLVAVPVDRSTQGRDPCARIALSDAAPVPLWPIAPGSELAAIADEALAR